MAKIKMREATCARTLTSKVPTRSWTSVLLVFCGIISILWCSAAVQCGSFRSNVGFCDFLQRCTNSPEACWTIPPITQPALDRLYVSVKDSSLCMSDIGSTHLQRTASLPRENVTAVGTVVQVRTLSKTVKGIAIRVPDTRFKFKAGQWVDFTIPGVETVGGFSMYSSPGKLEKHRVIDLAVKRSDHPPANWVHTKCHVGSEVTLKVGGDFFHEPLTERSQDLLLVAGGVGINPLHSIIQQISELQEEKTIDHDLKVSLLYSASSEDELIFKDELMVISSLYPNITCHFFVTKDQTVISPNPFQIRTGRITGGVLQEAIKEFTKDTAIAYICGPTPMIKFVTTILEDLGLKRSNIRKEMWW